MRGRAVAKVPLEGAAKGLLMVIADSRGNQIDFNSFVTQEAARGFEPERLYILANPHSDQTPEARGDIVVVYLAPYFEGVDVERWVRKTAVDASEQGTQGAGCSVDVEAGFGEYGSQSQRESLVFLDERQVAGGNSADHTAPFSSVRKVGVRGRLSTIREPRSKPSGGGVGVPSRPK